MANLKINKTKYNTYYRSRVYNVQGSINLDTSDKDEAIERHSEVCKVEKLLKRTGCIDRIVDYDWFWKEGNNSGRSKVKAQQIGVLIDKWLEFKKRNIKPNAYKRYVITMDRFIDMVGRTSPPRDINNDTIEGFKEMWKDKHSEGGININLRGIKAFLIWCKDEGYIKRVPKIVMYKPKKNKKPKYITDKHWNMIMKLDNNDEKIWGYLGGEFWKDVFKLYRSTGMRRGEGLNGYLDGKWYTCEDTKSGEELEIELNQFEIEVINKLHNARDEHIAKGRSPQTFEDKLTKYFANALKKIGIYESKVTTFHCLRHTFAVRLYLTTRDIKEVQEKLNHSNLSTTEIYTKLKYKRLEYDFPSLIKKPKIEVLDTKYLDTIEYKGSSSRLIN